MAFRFIEDAPTADVGFVASGATLDDCFQSAADATLSVMLANPEALQARVQHEVRVDDEALDIALLRFLEELVYHKDAHRELLRARDVCVHRDGERWIVEATLEGETIDPDRHGLAGDVKAVTLHQLQVRRIADGYEATVVLDV